MVVMYPPSLSQGTLTVTLWLVRQLCGRVPFRSFTGNINCDISAGEAMMVTMYLSSLSQGTLTVTF